MTEVNRIAEETDFNGTKVLEKDQKISIQVGADDGQTIEVDLKEINAATLGLDSFNVNGAQGTVAAAATANFETAYGDSTSIADSDVNDFGDDLATSLGIATGSVTADTANAYVDENGNWYAQVQVSAATEAESRTLAAQGINIASGSSVTFNVALDPQDADVTTDTTASFTVDGADLTAASLLTGASNNPLEQLDAALSDVDVLRSDLGAIQNRFESAITNLNTNETNLSAARSRIEDADYATEVADMTRAQILQQAGTSVLAQANQIPQNVLSLLG